MTDAIAVATRELVRQIEQAEKERDEAIGFADRMAWIFTEGLSQHRPEVVAQYAAWKAAR